MKIFVKVKPAAKEEKVEKIDEDHFLVFVKEPPVQGRANLAIIKIIAEYFNVSLSRVKIITGFTSRSKTIEIIK